MRCRAVSSAWAFRPLCSTLLTGLGLLAFPCGSHAATINLNLFNEDALVDMGSIPLLGNALSGDLVELWTPGVNGTIDAVDSFSGVPGDDVLFASSNNPTHVGAGTFGADTDSGLLSQTGMQFDSSLIGEFVYVRYWDSPSISTATAYGQIGLFAIPTESFPGEVFLNFNPSGSGTLMTDVSYTFLGSLAQSTPEPNVVLFLGLAIAIFGVRHKYQAATVKPQAYYMNKLKNQPDA